MFPDRWGSDYDHAQAHGNGRRETPYEPAHPLGRELSPEETAHELRKIVARLHARIAEHATRRCPHGINLERARCATCAPLSPMELGR